jgi:putative oxidoreductase
MDALVDPAVPAPTINERRGWWGIIVTVARVVASAVLLLSGIQKLQQPYDFMANVYDYELLGPPWGRLVAVVLPPLEILLGMSLVTGLLWRGAMIAAALLSALFVLAQSTVLARGLVVSCGCFGSYAESPVSAGSLTRTLLLFCLLSFAAMVSVKSRDGFEILHVR